MPPSSNEEERQETLRRKAVVLRYLEIDKPTVADADAAAVEIGCSRRTFYMLVAIFRERRGKHGSPTLRAPAKSRPKTRLTPALEEIIRTAVDQAADGDSIHQIGECARAAARKRGLAPPHDKTVARRMRALKNDPTKFASDPDITIDFSPLLANIGEFGQPAIPVAAAAIRTGDGRLLAVRIEIDEPTASNTDALIANALENWGVDHPWEKVTVRLSTAPGAQWRLLRRQLRAAGARVVGRIDDHMPMGTVLRRTQGDALGGVPMRPRIPTHELKSRVGLFTTTTIGELAGHLQTVLAVDTTVSAGAEMPSGAAASIIQRNMAAAVTAV